MANTAARAAALESTVLGHVGYGTMVASHPWTDVEPLILRVLIRQKLADGRLPHESTSRVTGRPSNGEICDACDEKIEPGQFVMQDGSTGANERALQFHVGCLYAWDTERHRTKVS